jgi:TnpA family transposase
MGRKAGGKDFSPRVRSIVDQVLEKMEKGGDARKLLEKQFREDFAGTLRAVAQYAPKQVDMSLTQTVSVDTTQVTDEILQQIINAKREADSTSEGPAPLH